MPPEMIRCISGKTESVTPDSDITLETDGNTTERYENGHQENVFQKKN